ncbi:MAG: hypothetical protein MPEBLZ_03110 [Candidatus Methanoperedens nitroreducens]|uniref:Uncharacterized protein n=1 Tax=Candidatus Methanoperedens nitratireducens TaxID=1392998 RepID=A0A0P8ADX1_9EURY|nr:S1 family peptidase [Candidatus Methanoperedens sp. BLZ2]KAB2947518.1 MAG: hypothetical protein F9K14_03680 [Candidatus Methanoperedens sp.]KPQ42393.1 MAG: hypothetical protein MPEBLZ_03110 [Candidatus Methanoperedens sp. BLZ1]MBZ0175101.1 S1 family peptidase [Candidatus Methanoperedens nitroreducens]MCX9078666.1 S1 family peptidase [Candidatus Methanoperedens sp.]
MKQIKGVQLGAMLAVILLVAVVFAGAAVPNKEFKSFPKDLPERVLLGLNDSELQDKEIPDFGPEVFEKIKKEPKVRETRGQIPKFKAEKERRDWLNKLDEIRVSVREDMRPYLYPNGPVIMYGWNDEGYLDVMFYENITMETSTVDGIYAVVDKQAKNIGLQKIPVAFRIGDFPRLRAGYDTKWRPIVGGIKFETPTHSGTLGFAVQDTNGNKGYVTARHLATQVGMQLWQPYEASENEAGIVSKIGTNTADASFIPFNNVEASIHIGGGYYVPVKGDRNPQIGWRVYKSGITSGITGGNVVGISEITSYDGVTYYNQAKTTMHSDGGDSGSPVWYLEPNSDRKIVGILASGQIIDGTEYTYFSQISYVKNSLNVNVLTR